MRFNVNKWHQYGRYFADDNAPTMTRLRATMSALTDGSIASTEAVEEVGSVLEDCLDKAFGLPRTSRKLSGSEDAPWWSEECQAARANMLALRYAVLPDDGPTSRLDRFHEARRLYNRVKREAEASWRAQEFEAFLRDCRVDPRKLWQKLKGGAPETCPLNDLGGWRTHFENLLNSGAITPASNLYNNILNLVNGGGSVAECEEWWKSCDAILAGQAVATEMLNNPFTLAEIEVALKRMPNNKATGAGERVPAECYRYAKAPPSNGERAPAVNRLVPVIHALLEHIRVSEDFPEQFTTTSLTPVFKRKGSDTVMGNYRGIAVGGALAKCYASILEKRLAAWCCSSDTLRNRFQAGFVHGVSTVHNLFAMRHLTNSTLIHSKQAYVPRP
jgi:hypothetical protein